MTTKDMPKTYDFKSTEERLYTWWEKRGYFKAHGSIHSLRGEPVQGVKSSV
jgi:valyl-tRNA synthetase